MKSWIIFDKTTGEIIKLKRADVHEKGLLGLSPSEDAVEGTFSDGLIDLDSMSPIPFPEKPSSYHEWDWPTKSWLPNIDSAKATKKAKIEAERNRRINEPLIYDGKVLDADQTARDNLKAKLEEVRERIRLNMPMAPELLVWRDNGNQTHSWPTIEGYHDWLAGYAVAMSDRGTRCYACAWYHKDALGQLSVMEDIMNYDLTQGWPA